MRCESKEFPSRASVLPSILDSYASPAGVRKAGNEEKPRSRRSEFVRDDDDLNREAAERRQAQLDKRHLESYRNARLLRDALYRRYAELLQKKVHQQRLEMQQRANQRRSKPVTDIQWKKERLAFSRLEHDAGYLENLPKTSFYLILDLQNKLTQRGVLRTRLDLEDFGRCINYHRGPLQIQDHLQEIRQKMIRTRPAEDWETSGSLRCEGEERSLDHRYLDSRPEDQDCVVRQGSGPGDGAAGRVLSRSLEETSETERMFPKMRLPKFATLHPSFGKNLTCKMVDERLPDLPKKSRKAVMHQRHLRHMFDASLSNMAVSKRMLGGERDTLSWREEWASQEPSCAERGPSGCSLHEKAESSRPSSQPRLYLLTSLPSPGGQHRPLRSPREEGKMSSQRIHRLETLDPLSLEDVCQQTDVQIINHMERLWSNYIGNSSC